MIIEKLNEIKYMIKDEPSCFLNIETNRKVIEDLDTIINILIIKKEAEK